MALALFGECDAHLKQIAAHMAVKIDPLGNAVVIRGPEKERVDQVRCLLNTLYATLEQGGRVNGESVEAGIHALAEAGSLGKLFAKEWVLKTPRRSIAPRTSRQAAYLESLSKNELTLAIGPAGTGKTYLAVAVAVMAFLENRLNRIILTRPAVEAGERLGFLPGDLQAKVDPFLRPLYDALYDMLGAEKVEQMLGRNVLEIASLAYMRGRTFHDSFIILDEAQNTTSMQMKMFLTRLGEGARAVVCGDITQIDLPIEGVGVVSFSSGDVVRSSLVRRIVRAYETAAVRSRFATVSSL
ncbi:MAG: PhoH family protein [Magnetococcus sp. DMHC-6]